MKFLLEKFNMQDILSFRFVPIIVLILSITASIIISIEMQQTIKKDASLRFNLNTKDASDDIVQLMKMYECALHASEGYFYGSDNVSKNEWKIFVDNLDLPKNYPGLQGLGFSLYIPKNKLQSHIKEYKQKYGDYEFKPAGERAEYSSIIYLEPLSWRNKRAIGYDMLSEQNRNNAMKKAQLTAQPQMTKAIRLVQETNTAPQAGILMYLPIYNSHTNAVKPEDREKSLFGFVYFPIRVNDFINSIFTDKNYPIAFRIYDGDPKSSTTTMLYNGISPASPNYLKEPMFTSSREIKFYGQTWTVVFQTQKTFESTIDTTKPIFMLISGIVISFLIFYMFKILISMREKSKKLAEKMTKQYHLANEELQLKNQTLNELNATLNEAVVSEVQKHLAIQEKEMRTKAHLASIVDSSQDAIISKDMNGVIISWNNGAETLFGYSEQEVIGQSMKILLPTDLTDEEEKFLSVIKQGGQLKQFETRRTNRTGSILVVSISSSPIFDANKNVIGASSIIRDITERKKWENELQKAKEEAQAASQAKSDFLTTMSHEIRTPMNAILGMAHLLLEANLTPKLKGFVSTIMSASNNLLFLINDILDFAKIEAGKMELCNVKFELDQTIDEVENIFSSRMGDKKLGFVSLYDEKTPATLFGDKDKLKQILLNLLSNALKFTHSGSITLHIKSISSDNSTVFMEFGVQDTGIGLNDKQISKLFRPFEQADTSTTRIYGGTGLGLAICKNLTELMGGEIGLTSKEGEGSYFYIRVPFVNMDELPNLFNIIKEKMPEKRLLIVDDNIDYARKLSALFEHLGIQSEYCSASDFAYFDLAEHYDAALIGIEPVLYSGISVIKELISKQLVEPSNIIALSSQQLDQTILHQDSSAIGFARKSISRSAMLDILMSVIDQKPYVKFLSGQQKEEFKSNKNILEHTYVLVVDDNHINLEMMQELLGSYKSNVTVASSGQEAIDIVKAGKSNFDVIFMDLQMPHMDGFEAARHIKELDISGMPIVALSADVTKQTVDKTNNIYFSEYLSKPIEPAELINCILKYSNTNMQFDHHVETQADNIFENFVAIDAQKGVRTVGGNTAVYVKLLKKFVHNYKDSSLKFHAHMSANNFEDAKHLAHTIKGVSGNFGMMELYEIIKKFEVALMANSFDKALLIEFDHEIQRCIADINSLENISIEAQSSAEDSSVTDEQIQNLLQQISNYQISAKENAENLYNSLSDESPLKVTLKNVLEALDSYNFVLAKTIIEDAG